MTQCEPDPGRASACNRHLICATSWPRRCRRWKSQLWLICVTADRAIASWMVSEIFECWTSGAGVSMRRS